MVTREENLTKNEALGGRWNGRSRTPGAQTPSGKR